MVGKVLLAILCVVLVLLLAVMLIPFSLRVSYEGGQLCVTAKYARFIIPIYPGKEKDAASDTAEEQPAAAKAKKKPGKPSEKNKPPINLEQILYSVDTLPKILLNAVRRIGKRIRIEPLKLHLLIATSDPADTAVLYGKIEGALAAGLPLLHRAVRIREQDIQLFPDFCEEHMDCIADAGIRIRPLDVLAVAVCALGGIIKWYIGFKKRATQVSETSKNKTVETTAQAEPAA